MFTRMLAGAVCGSLACLTLLAGCQTTGGAVQGNEDGSTPVNDKEREKYQKAIVRCYKTGGTRVVKIMGKLRCY